MQNLYRFMYSWTEWDNLVDGYDGPVTCPRCKPKTLSECDCLTPELAEDLGYDTAMVNGREWAVVGELDLNLHQEILITKVPFLANRVKPSTHQSKTDDDS